MAKDAFTFTWESYHNKRLTKRRALKVLKEEMDIKNKCFSFLVNKGLYAEFENFANFVRATEN